MKPRALKSESYILRLITKEWTTDNLDEVGLAIEADLRSGQLNPKEAEIVLSAVKTALEWRMQKLRDAKSVLELRHVDMVLDIGDSAITNKFLDSQLTLMDHTVDEMCAAVIRDFLSGILSEDDARRRIQKISNLPSVQLPNECAPGGLN